MSVLISGRGRVEGQVEAEAIVSQLPFGFWQGLDPQTGLVIDQRHDLVGLSLKDKVFVYPYGRGSTGTPGIFLEAVRNGVAPVAIINVNSEPMIQVCALLAKAFFEKSIPVVDGLERDPIETIKTGDRVRIDGRAGTVEIIRPKEV
jgi:predicted aconitase with swiveling domain